MPCDFDFDSGGSHPCPGAALPGAGHASLGALILAQLDRQAAAGQPPSAAALVAALAEAVPVFDDAGLYRGKQVRYACSTGVARPQTSAEAAGRAWRRRVAGNCRPNSLLEVVRW